MGPSQHLESPVCSSCDNCKLVAQVVVSLSAIVKVRSPLVVCPVCYQQGCIMYDMISCHEEPAPCRAVQGSAGQFRVLQGIDVGLFRVVQGSAG